MTDEMENCTFHQDPITQYQELIYVLQKNSTMAINDDYENWMANDFHCEAAKPLFIDQADYQTQHIFFDDNADSGEDCIVDVRDVVTKEILPYDKFINKFVVKVEPHRAILEVDYFIKMIEMAEQNRDQEIERVEQGIIDQAPEEVADQATREWEYLQSCSNEEFLMKTVLPVLYQGMKVLDQQRPVAPLEFLALYLLKHQHQIKLPQKPGSDDYDRSQMLTNQSVQQDSTHQI